ncbi:MAG: DUF4435 domain-containing protein [Clostridium sp.]|nr:DUF4435 domain-containing protein [Prevotella sp.]MCM1428292.1 DUF4435 domain-containing protein [Clostridium sp.]MCM1474764.1 DUF4435 domain-containing protein [Muribaculaceae bacterium]
MSSPLLLPAKTGADSSPLLPDTRQISLVGGNGAGKSRFMQELVRLCGDRAFCLSALKAPFPQDSSSQSPNSIDAMYRKMVESQPYMRTDAVSEIDKLSYMLFIDEFDYLLSVKDKKYTSGKKVDLAETKLDKLKAIWENLFPSNRVVRSGGLLMFSTGAGDDLISLSSLSQGEKTVFYYIAAVLFADHDSVIFIDSPSLFLHPSILNSLWNSIEQLRPDCTFVYDSVDEDFVASRTQNTCIWIKSYDSSSRSWSYDVLPYGNFSEDLFFDLIGGRKPVLFIEGDARHSIDSKLYALVFSDFSVRPLGSCDKVIETTRSFNDLKYMHHLDSHGIVDRDRRSDVEVAYLRRKNIFVPEVAEVENIFLLEDVIRIMAKTRGKKPETVLSKVKSSIIKMFAKHADEQALMHVRHKVKRDVECRIDAKFSNIDAMESHIESLIYQLKPRENFVQLQNDFHNMVKTKDYKAILKVFNYKPMLGDCGVAPLLGYKSKEDYISGVLGVLKSNSPSAKALRASMKYCFGLRMDQTYAEGFEPPEKPRLANHTKDSEAVTPRITAAETKSSHKKGQGKASRGLDDDDDFMASLGLNAIPTNKNEEELWERPKKIRHHRPSTPKRRRRDRF